MDRAPLMATPAASLRRRALRALAVLLLAAGLSGGAYAGYCGVLIATGNFHEVAPGALYRAAQMDGPTLDATLAAHGIRAVLNLRGANPDSDWYRDEIAVAARRGVAHYDIPLSARRPLSAPEMARLLNILRTAPKPLLIHCRSGADRSGLVAALYRYAVAHDPAAEAARELSLRYGHFPYLTSPTGAMDASFAAFVAAQGDGAAR